MAKREDGFEQDKLHVAVTSITPVGKRVGRRFYGGAL